MIRDSDVREQLAAGTDPTLDESTAEVWPSICAATIERDDVVVLHGGGGGLGDPLLRDPAMVAADLRDERVTVEAARRVYGVVVDDAGNADLERTDEVRLALRRARLHGQQPVALQGEVEPTAAVVVTDTEGEAMWACSACGHGLARVGQNWRVSAELTERPTTETLQERNQMVRERADAPPVVERAFACPSCASMLSVDIAFAGDQFDPAPQIGAQTVATV